MWARIQNSTVAEITDIDPANRFHPSILWEACPAETEIGWSYDGETFSPPPLEPLEELATRKRAEIASALADALAAGMPYTMPDGTEDVVQIRDVDRPNLLQLKMDAHDLAAAGETDAALEFRAASNTRYPMMPDEMLALIKAALEYYQMLKRRSWKRKDTIDSALSSGNRGAIEATAW